MNTERLTIRRFTADDFNDVFEYLSDPEVVKYEPYPAVTPEQGCEYLERMMNSADFWAVCLTDGDKQIGQVYLAEKDQNTWEVGYVFNSRYQRQGYASEAVARLLSHVFADCGAHRVFAHCNPENVPSWKLLERLGFRREAHLKQNVYFHTDEHDNPLWQDTFEYAVLSFEFING
jgi:RimJ/RimL family protein N-acetyltransferase